MKKQYCPLFRLAAFVVLVAFTAVSCYIPTSPDPVSSNVPRKPSYPVTVVVGSGPGQSVAAEQVSFYLTDDFESAETDTGKTAFVLDGRDAPKNFMATAEEKVKDTVVRFLDGDMAVSLYFFGDSAFPDGFILNQGEDDMLIGKFSAYYESTETFSLTLQYEEDSHPFEGLVLNKNVFGVYQDDINLSPGQNVRIRNYITAVAVWTAMTLRFSEELAVDGTDTPEGIGASGSITGMELSFFDDIGNFFNDVGTGIVKAAQNLCAIGGKIAVAAALAFRVAYEVVATENTPIGITVAAPAAVAVAVPVVIVVTVGEKPSEPSSLPPEKSKAPQFKIWYEDESGQEQLIPVMREGVNPELAQEFYIRPQTFGDYTSDVKFFFKVAQIEASDEVPLLSFDFSPENSSYYKKENIGSGTENSNQYFEIKQQTGGSSAEKRTALTIKVINQTATTDEKNPVYFPYYYVNGEEFTGGNGFVINFLDYATPDEQKQVLIPKHEVTETPPTVNAPPFLPFINIVSYPYVNESTVFPGSLVLFNRTAVAP